MEIIEYFSSCLSKNVFRVPPDFTVFISKSIIDCFILFYDESLSDLTVLIK